MLLFILDCFLFIFLPLAVTAIAALRLSRWTQRANKASIARRNLVYSRGMLVFAVLVLLMAALLIIASRLPQSTDAGYVYGPNKWAGPLEAYAILPGLLAVTVALNLILLKARKRKQ